MSAKTGIEWTDASWNPVRGCSRVSEGCRKCYAEKIAARFSDEGLPFHLFADRDKSGSKWTGKVELIEEALTIPLHWRKPRRIFVNSMSDLFHENLPDEAIDRVFAVMALCPQHTFQVLTKRPERMLRYLTETHGFAARRRVQDIIDPVGKERRHCAGRQLETNLIAFRLVDGGWPLPNVWLGVSVENRPNKYRMGELVETPAAKRFVSIEPLLEDIGELGLQGIDWVICGGESGPGARPMHPDWARSVRDQCVAASVAFFFKQWGKFQNGSIEFGGPRDYIVLNDGRFCKEYDLNIFQGSNPDVIDKWLEFRPVAMGRVGKKKAGALLDGREWREFPEKRS